MNQKCRELESVSTKKLIHWKAFNLKIGTIYYKVYYKTLELNVTYVKIMTVTKLGGFQWVL